MISPIDSSNLAYIPTSRPANVSAAPEEKSLNSQSAQPINYNPSLSNSISAKGAAQPEEVDGQNTQAPEDDVAKQQEQVQQVIAQLKARDREVRTHEMAHLAAAGSYAMGGMNLSYQRGPDGQQYAIGGSVQIDTSAIPGDPEATIQKGRVVQQAAMAPAEPSGQDRKVASAASQMIASAQAELIKTEREERAVEQNGRSAQKENEEGSASATNEISAKESGKAQLTGNDSNTSASQTAALYTPDNVARSQFDLRMQVAAG